MKHKINVKRLSTAIMIVHGIHGHGQCRGQSTITAYVLRKMGHPAVLVGGFHAINIPAEDRDNFIVHAPTQLLPHLIEHAHQVQAMEDVDTRTWHHCWVESGKQIIDVNMETVTSKKYVDIKNWNKKHLTQGKEYYMPTDYTLDAEVPSENFMRKIDQTIEIYDKLCSPYYMETMTEEGPIHITSDGSWYPLPGYQVNAEIRPNTRDMIRMGLSA